MIKLYLNDQGDLIGEEQSVLSKENLDMMEAILSSQKKEREKEEEEIKLRKKFLLK
jgi:hypothetical protein